MVYYNKPFISYVIQFYDKQAFPHTQLNTSTMTMMSMMTMIREAS